MSTTELAVVVGRNISTARRRLGLTQAQLAERLDIGQDALSRMEKGLIAPKMGRLRELAAALGCSVADLFREPEEGERERAAAIVDMLRPLSPQAQEAILEAVAQMARVMKQGGESTSLPAAAGTDQEERA